jgi:vacuolar-type H+-ATPase subunit I/STV1
LKLLNSPQPETNTGTKMSYGYEYLGKPEHPPASLIERILSVMAVLGLACLFIGSILFVSGNGFSNLMIARIGAYILVIGIMLVAPRLLFWIVTKIVELG